MKRIIRVFPRRTRATPNDNLVAVARRPGFFDKADAIHISVSFTYDMDYAMKLATQWECVAPVTIGGPATGEKSGEFVPGMYVKQGYTITSRGCPNKCWFCSVWKREGKTRELLIRDGWNVLDDNILACSTNHIRAVFDMLKRQKHKPEFTGGLEAKRIKPWIAKALFELKPQQLFFAYDTEDDFEPLNEATKIMHKTGFSEIAHILRCYVLCGYPKDTLPQAEKRLERTLKIGLLPMAMLYKDKTGLNNKTWSRFVRQWARPAIIYANQKRKQQEQLSMENHVTKSIGFGLVD